MSVHDGHRDRLKQNFLENGLDGFNDITALELLLFYAIPRKDTNVIAHRLLERFGSLSGVMEAGVRELTEVEGVGENAAAFLNLLPQFMRKAGVSQAKEDKTITNSQKAGKYLLPHFMYRKEEHILLLCLNSRKRVISCTEISSGVVNAADTSTRKIAEIALRNRASSVILAHNHPPGIALPSREDDYMTRQVYESLRLVGITLLDHIIVSGDDFVSYADSGFFNIL